MTVSILCPTLNAASYLRSALESLIRQSFTDFEVLLLDGGSEDQTKEIFDSFRDSRLKWVDCREHRSLAESLNFGITQARGDFLVRQDADDISISDRIEKQLWFLKQNPNVALVGSNTQTISLTDAIVSEPWWSLRHVPLNWDLLWGNQLIHSSVMIRKKVLDDLQLKYEKVSSEDYRLWCRLAEHSALARLPEVLVYYRVTDGGLFNRTRPRSFADALVSNYSLVRNLTGMEPPPYHYFLTDDYIDSRHHIAEIRAILSEQAGTSIQLQDQGEDLLSLAAWMQTVFQAARQRWHWDVGTCEEVQEDIARRVSKIYFLTWKNRKIFDYRHVLQPARDLRSYPWMIKDFVKIILHVTGLR
jgi:glycosyltransferase involved in cell wall biosynthesis